jgi:uncharacterized protein YeeX (DUF496 family)
MKFTLNQTKEKLLNAIHGINALISDDTKYEEVSHMEYSVDYKNNISTEELIRIINELEEIYAQAPDAYYVQGE